MKYATLAFLFLVQFCHAQLVMDFTGGDDLSVGPGTAGYEFTTANAFTIRSLGLWDSDPTTPGLYSSHTIGLWDAETHALLASATVPAQGATAIGAFWYVPIAPLTLQSGHSYVLGATYADSDFDFARGNIATVSMGLGAALGDALLSSGTGFEFPDLVVNGANKGFIGPNALETSVPELGFTGVFSALCLGAFVVWRRFRQSVVVGVAVLVGLIVALSARADDRPVTIRDVLDAKPQDQKRLLILLSKQKPIAAQILGPATNRPPITPGNENGQRPIVPPGLRNYATP